MPIQDYFPIDFDSALFRWFKRIPHLYKKGVGEESIEESYTSSNLMKLCATMALEDQEIWDVLKQVSAARSLFGATGYLLTLRAHVVGIDRLAGETDQWLRERCLFWIYVQYSHCAPHQIKKIAAWYAGIYKKDITWLTTIYPYVWVYKDLAPAGPERGRPGYRTLVDIIEIHAPGAVLDYRLPDYWKLTGATGGAGWQADSTHGLGIGKVHGSFLALDLMDLIEAMVPMGTKVAVYRAGAPFTGAAGGAGWQARTDGDDGRMGGYMELHGPDHVYNHDTEPNGAFHLYPNRFQPNVVKQAPPNQIFRPGYVGQRIFRDVCHRSDQWVES